MELIEWQEGDPAFRPMRWLVSGTEIGRDVRPYIGLIWVEEDRVVCTEGHKLFMIKAGNELYVPDLKPGAYHIEKVLKRSIQVSYTEDRVYPPNWDRVLPNIKEYPDILDLGEYSMEANFCRMIKLLPENVFVNYEWYREAVEIMDVGVAWVPPDVHHPFAFEDTRAGSFAIIMPRKAQP